MTWELIWKISLIGVLIAFTLMSVLVTIFGARDVRRLIHQLDENGQKGKGKDS